MSLAEKHATERLGVPSLWIRHNPESARSGTQSFYLSRCLDTPIQNSFQIRAPERCESPRHMLRKNTTNEISSIAMFHYLNIFLSLRSSKFRPQIKKK